MNYNVTGYFCYAALTFFIIFWVGYVFYRNGRLYILGLFEGDEQATDRTNRLLLTGYYLLNIGYALVSIRNWETITSAAGLISSVCNKTGFLVMMLASIHYINMAVLQFVAHKYTRLFHHS